MAPGEYIEKRGAKEPEESPISKLRISEYFLFSVSVSLCLFLSCSCCISISHSYIPMEASVFEREKNFFLMRLVQFVSREQF